MRLEVTYYQDLLKENPKDPENPILLKKNAKYKNYINTEDIKVVSWYYNRRGQRVKSKCQILHTDLGVITINKPYEEVQSYLQDKPHTIKGFRK